MPVNRNRATDIFGIPDRNAVGFAFCHLFLHGIFVTAFVFSNSCYPPFYYVDYLYGGSGAVLIVVAAVGYVVAYLRKWQPLRSFWAFLVVLNVLTVSAGGLYYTIERWDDIETTAFMQLFRKPGHRDFPDNLWYSLSVISCIMIAPFLVYLVCIMTFMCKEGNFDLLSGPADSQPVALINLRRFRPANQYQAQRE